jgi:organic radical activating enzyme
MNKIFPIKSDTACLLKWSWSTVFLGTGKTSSCHRVQQDEITPETFNDFHNTPAKLKARSLMRQGIWPKSGCEYCEKIEAAGGVSDRQFNLKNLHYKYAHELDIDPTLDRVTPTILEAYFSNVCNMACLYCGPHFSSKWEAENNKHGEFNYKNLSLYTTKDVGFNSNYEKMVSQFWEWLKNNHHNVRDFHILGGEPFYQNELDQLIEFFNHNPNPNLKLSFVSNLKVEQKKFKETIDRFMDLKKQKKIGLFHITGSLDCWGPQQEYIRYGLNLNQFVENFEYMLDKDIILTINGAINALSIKTMPEYIRKINYWNSIRKEYDPKPSSHIYYSFMTVTTPHCMVPDIFRSGFFKEDFEEIVSNMPTNTDYQKNSKMHMEGIAKQVEAGPENLEQIDILKTYLTEMDWRRGTNWRATFPWLANYN